jgi:hypothetical protein
MSFCAPQGPLHFLKLSSLFVYCAVEPGVRLNSIRGRLVKARLRRGTAKTGSRAFSAHSSFLTIRPPCLVRFSKRQEMAFAQLFAESLGVNGIVVVVIALRRLGWPRRVRSLFILRGKGSPITVPWKVNE